MISWLSFMFFVIGATGGCLYLFQLIRAGMRQQPLPAFKPSPVYSGKVTPLPLAPRPGRAVKVEPAVEASAQVDETKQEKKS